ncbi:heavy metal translocating P-type ATPase [Lactococcus petauri]|uniref:Cd(2+)-exporting ATPase n=1 Tax=Lactococcus petauri TaxID=1940789 RepID=A0ABZ2SFB9_9LACT|nr:heavy metal translocating P-type ATPase [Lactococcus petauri]OAL09531.1 Cation-transporting P-type ATPase [Lactococcus garvieae]MCI3871053.1 cadmium-translocating P-type ATPase [Lactococcus petauri]MCQ8275450.1 Cadmium, zinc and cobalt-transporting ATPase [Lactococcus petauri]MCR6588762.1 heavy metal translocating P-type ATPase [Lactococcus petauri]MCU7363571.1 heavy metal translocating P-type ATPase [Lactococcus petauri]
MFKSTQNKATHDARCVKGTCNCLNHKAKAALTTAEESEGSSSSEVTGSSDDSDPACCNTTIHLNTSLDEGEEEGKYELLIIIITALLLAALSFLDFTPQFKTPLFILTYLLIGHSVLLKAIKQLLKGDIFNEFFLMSIATVGAFALGEYAEAVAVMLFYQVGEYFQDRAIGNSKKSITALMDLRPEVATVKRQGKLIDMSPEEVNIGEVIQVKPGEKVPLDGLVLSGKSSVNTAALTGESLPREVSKGEEVLSGFLNINSLLEIKVEKTFGESSVSKILNLVENAQENKAPTEQFISKFARYYTPVVVFAAAIIALVPPLFFQQDWSDWLTRAFTFLIISCPCAMVVSIPLGFFAGIGTASKNGILVKGGNHLEAMTKIKHVLFDKTGTLTQGNFKVTQVFPAEDVAREDLLYLGAIGELNSTHPLGLALKENQNLDTVNVTESEEISGHGTRTFYESDEILVGNAKLMKMYNVNFTESNALGSLIYVAKNGIYQGVILVADVLKEDAEEAIAALNQLHISQTMLTGDSEKVAAQVAGKLNITDYHANLLPEDKVALLEQVIAKGDGLTAFVGDGINDAPVIARADIGFAMGGLGSDAAIETADVVLMTDKPSSIAKSVKIAKKTKRLVVQNIVLALGVKAVFLILAVFGIATMWEAVIADVGVTLIAILNVLRLLK